MTDLAAAVFDGLPLNYFGAILADPPWHFRTHSSRGAATVPGDRTDAAGSRQPPYPTMSLSAIKGLPVADLAAPDCVLFLWVTDPFLQVAFDVLDAWGFEYKTVGFTWTKLKPRVSTRLWLDDDDLFMGTGYWTRANPEMCLLATRGKPKRVAKDVRQQIVSPVREHSRKPDCQYDRIERLVAGPYLELFSRTGRPTWSAWGADAGQFGGGEH